METYGIVRKRMIGNFCCCIFVPGNKKTRHARTPSSKRKLKGIYDKTRKKLCIMKSGQACLEKIHKKTK